MDFKTKFALGATVVAFLLLLATCNNTEPSDPDPNPSTGGDITAVGFPNTGIPGFTFPTDSNTLNGWIYGGDSAELIKHAWGIWTGLTMPTGDSLHGAELRVYETWFTIPEMKAMTSANVTPAEFDEQNTRGERASVRKPTQFGHTLGADADPLLSVPIYETIYYDPTGAAHAVSNKLFVKDTLLKMLADSLGEIPAFPSTAIAIKPVYIPLNDFIKEADGTYRVPVWPGPPNPAISWPDSLWNNYVYVSTDGSGSGPDVRPIDDFIHYTLTAAAAEQFNSQFKGSSPDRAKEGDIAILVGMHVNSRENLRWTWQTFWFSKNPDTPHFPSLQAYADGRPTELVGAPRNYAVTLAYSMVQPAQPETGGINTGDPVLAYNPYLEAPFDTSVFVRPGVINKPSGTGQFEHYVGVQTNCMSCHLMANISTVPTLPDGMPGYITDEYFPYDADSLFRQRLRTDFLWSVAIEAD